MHIKVLKRFNKRKRLQNQFKAKKIYETNVKSVYSIKRKKWLFDITDFSNVVTYGIHRLAYLIAMVDHCNYQNYSLDNKKGMREIKIPCGRTLVIRCLKVSIILSVPRVPF